MPLSMIWLISAAVLVLIELITGTFYILVLAASAAISSLAAFLQVSLSWQLCVFAVLSFLGCYFVHHYRIHFNLTHKESENLQNLDMGKTVKVIKIEVDGSSTVKYRGADWKAYAEKNETLVPGTWKISQVDGNILRLTQK